MSRRPLVSQFVTTAIVVVLSATGFVGGQSQTPAKTPAIAKAAREWAPPRTPWGDPDLQGTFTNSNEYATPLERPERFAGRRLEDITDEELANVRRAAEQQAIAGLAQGPRGPDYWWLENLDLSKRTQPWLVVDPPDGKIPALTREAQRRALATGV